MKPFRLVFRQLHGVLNVVGLALGLAVCIVLALFVHHEMSYDRWFANGDRLIRISQSFPGANRNAQPFASSNKVAELFPGAFPEIEAISRHVLFGNTVQLKVGDKQFPEAGLRYADEQFLQLFDFPVVVGDVAAALASPDGAVLTRELAIKLFGRAEALGETFTVDGTIDLTVRAIVEVPGNTHFNFTVLAPMRIYDQRLAQRGVGTGQSQWGQVFTSTYALLRAGASIGDLEAKLPAFIERESGSSNFPLSFVIEAVPEIHLRQSFEGGSAGFTNWQRVQLFGSIAAGILLIALVNFMNLATATAARRAREVGVKVALGAGRSAVIRQFLLEAIVTVAVAMTLALVLAELLLPLVNTAMQWQLGFAAVPGVPAALLLVMSTVLLGLLAGSYPAFYLSAWQPAKVLRGELTRGRAGRWFRSVLVVVQFTLAIALIVASLVMRAQLAFSTEFDMGFDATNVHVLRLPGGIDVTTKQTLVDQVRTIPGVIDATYAFSTPLLESRLATQSRSDQSDVENVDLTLMSGADNIQTFYRIDLLAGRTLGEDGRNDTLRMVPRDASDVVPQGGVVIGEAVAARFGWTVSEAVGKTLRMPTREGMYLTTVVGVARDLRTSTRNEPVLLFYVRSDDPIFNAFPGVMSIRVTPELEQSALADLRALVTRTFPSEAIQLSVLADTIAGQYVSDRRQMAVFGWSAVFAVLIACLGLYGLASFNTEQRTKEIGVRKVLGGSVLSIVLLLTNEFSRLVLAANLIAWPLAYVAMQRWLQNFAYHIDLTPLVFIGSGLIALCIAWVTVGGTAARAASAKPVLALRYE